MSTQADIIVRVHACVRALECTLAWAASSSPGMGKRGQVLAEVGGVTVMGGWLKDWGEGLERWW